MDCSLPGSSAHGIFQAKILEWVAISFYRKCLINSNYFYVYCCCLVAQSCPTLCNPMDCSPPGSSVHGISQAGILEWIAISFSRGFFRPRDRTCISCIGVCVCAKSHRQILYHWPPNGTVLSSFALSFMLGSVQQNLCTGQVPGPW